MVFVSRAAHIAAEIAEAICQGELHPGDPLPARRVLMGEHQVAINTATAAVDKLAAAGLVRGQLGRGTFVLNPAGTPVGELLRAGQACRSAAEHPSPLDTLGRSVVAWMGEAFTTTALHALDGHGPDGHAVAAAQAVLAYAARHGE